MKADKPSLSFWQIWNMNFGFLGIQFGFALQNANVSRIFQTLGAEVDEIAILWIAAPTTGLLVQPIIGYLSDRTWSPRFGRRKPFFTIGAVFASIALIFMPHSSTLWMAAGMLWILDASINISMEPFRALVGDMMPQKQRTVGFAMQTFFIGVGAVVASALPYILTNWAGMDSTAPKGEIPDTVIWSFYLGSAVFFAAVMWTVFNTKEYPPEEFNAYNEVEEEQEGGGIMSIFKDLFSMPKTMAQLAVVQFFSWLALFAMWIYTTTAITSHIYDMNMNQNDFNQLKSYIALVETDGAEEKEELKKNKERMEFLEPKFKDKDEVSMDLGLVTYALDDNILKEKELINILYMSLKDKKGEKIDPIKEKLEKLRKKIKDSTDVQLDAKTVNFFVENKDIDLKMNEEETTKLQMFAKLKNIQQEYNNGGDWVGVMFAVYNGLSALFAFLFPPFARATSRKTAHMVGLVAGGLGLISMYFMSSPEMLLISMVGVGFAWASILTMPYAILAGALPANKMGIYMGIFNFFIVLPQILAASLFGFVTKNLFGGEAIYTIIVGGVSMILAAVLMVFVKDK